jgi:UDP-N-acetylmuramate--alanine ligase
VPETGTHPMGRVRHVHFVGIGGAGMSGIAEVMHNLGYVVSGSDMKDSPTTNHLRELGVQVAIGHSARQVNGSDVLVVSGAVADDNSEIVAARKKRIPIIPRAEMLAELMRFRHGIAVAGTHGKTTTTSLIASLLAEGGLDPTYVVGGRLISTGSHARLGTGKYLVAEADESDASFLHLQPVISVVTNIDADHLETYAGDIQGLHTVFLEFLHHLPFYGLAVVCVDDPGVKSILEKISKPLVTYALDVEADFVAHGLKASGLQMQFSVAHGGDRQWLQVTLNLPGRHNVLNALAAIAVATELGVTREKIANALRQFQGIRRRCEVLGTLALDGKQVTVVDDYGHHPTEIAATLNAIRAGWPGRRVVGIFQPHRYTRTRDLFEEFCQALSHFDALVIVNLYPAGEKPIAGADSESLCRALQERGRVKPVFIKQRAKVAAALPGICGDGDILLVLGAGDIGTLGHELLRGHGN